MIQSAFDAFIIWIITFGSITLLYSAIFFIDLEWYKRRMTRRHDTLFQKWSRGMARVHVLSMTLFLFIVVGNSIGQM